MSINLGTQALDAIRAMRGTTHWETFCAALEELARGKLHAALESPVENRVDATGYARGIHDIHHAVAAANLLVNPRAVGKLGAHKAVPVLAVGEPV